MNRAEIVKHDSSLWLLPDDDDLTTNPKEDFKKKSNNEQDYLIDDDFEDHKEFGMSFQKVNDQSYVSSKAEQSNRQTKQDWRRQESRYSSNNQSLSFQPKKERSRYKQNPEPREGTRRFEAQPEHEPKTSWQPRKEQPREQQKARYVPKQRQADSNFSRQNSKADSFQKAPYRSNQPFLKNKPNSMDYLVTNTNEFVDNEKPVSNLEVVYTIRLNTTRLMLTNRPALEHAKEKDFLMVPYTNTSRNMYPMQELKDFRPGELEAYINNRRKEIKSTIILKYPTKQMTGLLLVDVTNNPIEALTYAFHQLDYIYTPCKNLIVPYMFEPTDRQSIESFTGCIFDYFRKHNSKIQQVSICLHSDILFFQCEEAFNKRLLPLILTKQDIIEAQERLTKPRTSDRN